MNDKNSTISKIKNVFFFEKTSLFGGYCAISTSLLKGIELKKILLILFSLKEEKEYRFLLTKKRWACCT